MNEENKNNFLIVVCSGIVIIKIMIFVSIFIIKYIISEIPDIWKIITNLFQ